MVQYIITPEGVDLGQLGAESLVCSIWVNGCLQRQLNSVADALLLILSVGRDDS